MNAAIESYLDLYEWQIKGIIEAVKEADSPIAEWTNQANVKAKWETKSVIKWIRRAELDLDQVEAYVTLDNPRAAIRIQRRKNKNSRAREWGIYGLKPHSRARKTKTTGDLLREEASSF